MKDEIFKACPSAYGVLINHYCQQYADNGVSYVELSFSAGGLLTSATFLVIVDKSFDTSLCPAISVSRKSKPAAGPTSGSLPADVASESNFNLETSQALISDSVLESAVKRARYEPFLTTAGTDHLQLSASLDLRGDISDAYMSSQVDTQTVDISPLTHNLSTSTQGLGANEDLCEEGILLVPLQGSTAVTASDASAVPPFISKPFLVPREQTGRNNSIPWKSFLLYNSKPRKQVVTFLAAVSRCKPGDAVFCEVDDAGNWSPLQGPVESRRQSQYTADHSLANKHYGDIASNNEKMSLFLKNEHVTQSSTNAPHVHADTAETLLLFAKRITEDDNLAKVYPNQFTNESICGRLTEVLSLADRNDELAVRQRRAIVGLDWVGDELGHPFCIFSHSKYIALVKKWQKFNSKFGIRIHAGEGPLRPSTVDPSDSPVRLAFYLHMYIVVEGIKNIVNKLVEIGANVNVRIGHGVAFLFGINEDENDKDFFMKYLEDFRMNYLVERNIVCELNPTSNHMLLSASFHNHKSLSNVRTLQAFLRHDLPVCLGTDDDGIWAIAKCKEHSQHCRYCTSTSLDRCLIQFIVLQGNIVKPSSTATSAP
jgi:adenosine deaminase